VPSGRSVDIGRREKGAILPVEKIEGRSTIVSILEGGAGSPNWKNSGGTIQKRDGPIGESSGLRF